MSYNDLERLRAEYEHRQIRLKGSSLYSPLNVAYLFMIQQRQRAVLDLFRKLGMRSLAHVRILEVGCGQGDVLHDLLFHRMVSHNLHGAELLSDRLMIAKQRFPGINYVIADAQNLPYADFRFDLVLQYTVFSSVLDDDIKASMAREMLRVVKKPGGLILWYDFWLNPTNAQTKGIRKAEIKRLFPNCGFTFLRTTLAPPIARKLVPFSWSLSLLLEKLTLLNTHFLVAIRPNVVNS